MSEIENDLIERAVRATYSDISGHAATAVQIADAAPVLIDHGRQQEREKWTARIEKLAGKFDQNATSCNDREVAALIRSLLTEEGDDE